MKAICIVAHPDDCVIYGYAFIHAHSNFDWEICYLTYNTLSERGKEISNFWSKRGISVEFLNFTDNSNDNKVNEISFDVIKAQQSIVSKINTADLILTHGPTGEYGHIHHKFVYECCKEHSALVTFVSHEYSYSLADAYRHTNKDQLKIINWLIKETGTENICFEEDNLVIDNKIIHNISTENTVRVIDLLNVRQSCVIYTEYRLPYNTYNLDELPLHRKVVERFVNPTAQISFYVITKEANELLMQT
jgi:hypothetical protein